MGDGAEQEAGRRTAALEHRSREGGPGGLETDKPDLVGPELEAEAQAPLREAQHFDCRGGNFRADAVARQYDDAHGGPPRLAAPCGACGLVP